MTQDVQVRRDEPSGDAPQAVIARQGARDADALSLAVGTPERDAIAMGYIIAGFGRDHLGCAALADLGSCREGGGNLKVA